MSLSRMGLHLPFASLIAFATIAIALAAVLLPLRHGRAQYLIPAAAVSSLLVLPFMILELVNRRAYGEGFPLVLFGLLWLLPLSFVVILVPLVRNMPARHGAIRNPLSLLPALVCLILIAWLWISLILDQMPCFWAYRTATRGYV